MAKHKEINFVGQPIFKQIINLVDKVNISTIVKAHDSDRYHKAFETRTYLITMLFGSLSRCTSIAEIFEGLWALGGKLNHLGLLKVPAKLTASDILKAVIQKLHKQGITPALAG
ncbi:MAG TPA: DUF4372 domain-containing protein [Bacteroidales bacterium]|nr:DUF4372 domain-containing protein [Bacteroidales bacterium]